MSASIAASSVWRSTLGFSTRLAAVTKITSALQSSDRSLSPVDARREATLVETKLYDEATSSEDYAKRCEQKIEEYGQQCADPIQIERDDDPLPSPTGMDIGAYKNAKYHKEGLFSTIYKAKIPESNSSSTGDPTSDGLVALKITVPSTMEPPHDSKREAKILELARSNHVLPLIETFREPGSRFVLVFPFMPYDFDQLLQNKQLSKGQIRTCLRDLFSALAFIHSHGIIHRDIKPSNILVKALDGPAYLSDFGISWTPESPGSEAADSKITDVGTTCYRPPELLFGNKRYGCQLDLWAVGCTVAEALMPDHQTLFDSGELGSDLALVQSIFSKLGTPNLSVWPEAANLPDWGKVQFHEYPPQPWSSLLPGLSEVEQQMVRELVQYESASRMTADKALQHAYFKQ